LRGEAIGAADFLLPALACALLAWACLAGVAQRLRALPG
jgi:hypothetical protein